MKDSVVLFNCRHLFDFEDLVHIIHSRELFDSVLLVVDASQKEFVEKNGYHFVEVDFNNSAEFIPKIRQFQRERNLSFVGVVGVDDECQFESTREIAEAFGLPYFSRETLDYASNKYVMKERFRKFGVPCARHNLVDDWSDPAEGLDFPVVLKPAYGVGSSYVFLCESPRKLAERLAYARRRIKEDPDFSGSKKFVEVAGKLLNPAESLIIEEYLEGPEFSCDYSVFDGSVGVVRVVKKIPNQTHLGMFDGYQLLDPERMGSDHGFTVRELESLCGRVAEAIGFSEGVFMMDFKLTGDGLKVLETAPRPGVSTFIPLMNLVYGWNSFDVLIRKRIGLNPPVRPAQMDGLVVELIADYGGRIVEYSINGMDEVERKFGCKVLSVYTYDSAGEILLNEPGMHLDLIVGYVLIKTNPGVDPLKVRDFIYNNTKLLIDDGSGVKNGFRERSSLHDKYGYWEPAERLKRRPHASA